MAASNAVSSTSGFNVQVDKKTGAIKAPPTISNINPKEISDAYAEALDASLIKPQEKLDKINERLEAMAEIRIKTQAYQEAAKALRGTSPLPGESGVFSYTKASYSPVGGIPGDAFLTIVTDPGVEPTSFTVRVNRLAQIDVVKAGDALNTLSSGANIQGSLTFPHIDGTSDDITVEINATDTGMEVKHKINTFKASTGIEAEWVPSNGDYKLVFKSLKSAQPVVFDKNLSLGNDFVPESRDVTEPDLAAFKEGLRAEIIYRGETSQYDTNAFKINGMSFKLTQADPLNDMTVTIDKSPLDIAEHIQKWVDSHNELVETIAKYTKIDLNAFDVSSSDSENIKVPLLASNSLAIEMKNYFPMLFAGKIPGLQDATMRSIADIGIRVLKDSKDGQLEIDMLVLNEALQKHMPELEKIFGFQQNSTNPQMKIIKHPNIIPSTLIENNIDDELVKNSISLTISKDAGGVLSAVMTNQGPNPEVYHVPVDDITEADGYIAIKINNDSLYKGFSFHFIGSLANNETQGAEFQISQGVGDKSIQYTNRLLNYKNGDFELQSEQFNEELKRQNTAIERLKTRNEHQLAALEKKLLNAIDVAAQVDSLMKKVMAMESALAN